jgi:predicted nucleotidyltransferase
LSEAFRHAVERSLRFSQMRSKYKDLLRQFKAELEHLLQSPFRMLVFGSVVEGRSGPTSDIDVMVISDEFRELEKRLKTYDLARRVFGSPHPFELHLITQGEFEWYRRFVSRYEEIP